jgi:hypothetical protein
VEEEKGRRRERYIGRREREIEEEGRNKVDGKKVMRRESEKKNTYRNKRPSGFA